MTEQTTDADGDTSGQDSTVEVNHHQRHRNGDETLVLLLSLADGYQAIALEADAGGQLLETEAIGDAEDRETAIGMCKYWTQQHPKGILGPADDDDSNAGLLETLGFGSGSA